jgi:hypothetical protein
LIGTSIRLPLFFTSSEVTVVHAAELYESLKLDDGLGQA